MGSSKEREKDTVLQDLEKHPLSDQELSSLLPRLKKTYLWLVGIIAVILMLSYLFVTFPLADIIIGRVDSQLLSHTTLKTKDVIIEFEPLILQQLQSYYLTNQQTEFSMCMGGRVEGRIEGAGVGNTNYQITSLYFPPMYKRLFNQVIFEPCSADTLILLHSHPYKRCSASATDLKTLKKAQQENPSTLMIVMCEQERFSVYS